MATQKKRNPLRILRIFLATLSFLILLLLFVDFMNKMPNGINLMAKIQIVPAIMSGFLIALVLQVILALLFGRIYCSILCPLGILQDIINRIFSFKRKKTKGIRRFAYHKPLNGLRYGLLMVVSVLAVLGFTLPLLFLDPYSNFGRIADQLFRPAIMWINNQLSMGLAQMDNYALVTVAIKTVSTFGWVTALTTLIVLIVMVIFHGRLFCNTLCPVGATLSLLSRFSIFRIKIDPTKCINCKLCERNCKAEAINATEMTVDTSRCVTCFNCLKDCPKDAISYTFAPTFLTKTKKQPVNPTTQPSVKETLSNGRRNFLNTSALVVATIPTAILAQHGLGPRDGRGKGKGLGRRLQKHECKEDHLDRSKPITPPGSISLERFRDSCTGCQLCVTHCPSQVLVPAGIEYGFEYMLHPYMSYKSSYCNYNCTDCIDICPTGALKLLTLDQKQTTQIGKVHFHRGKCVVKVDGTDCGACAEHCPTGAIKMVPFRGTLTIPEVDPSACVGCGGCESICPAQAIEVIANPVHLPVEKPKPEEVKKVQVDDFGF